MGLLDKVVSAVTPEASEQERQTARAKALQMAGGNGGWLSMVVDQHEQIETTFAMVKQASGADARREAQKKLARLLTGHALAEDTVLYPEMALTDQKAHSGEAYTQQSATKVQVAALEELAPMSQDYLDKLEHLRAAVAHHIYQEENKWFPKLHEAAQGPKQAHLTRRYTEEFERYMGHGTQPG